MGLNLVMWNPLVHMNESTYSVDAYCSVCDVLIFHVEGPIGEERRLYIELNAPKTVFCLHEEHNTGLTLNFNYRLEWHTYEHTIETPARSS